MTVAELIAELAGYGDDLRVLVPNQDGILCNALVSKGDGYILIEAGKEKQE
jgi:hypothetical protein